jgi:hypothetical protein
VSATMQNSRKLMCQRTDVRGLAMA